MKPYLTTGPRLAIAALAVALSATACASDSPTGSDGSNGSNGSNGDTQSLTGFVGERSTADPVQGGTLTMADYAEARSLNPTETIATGASGGNALAAVYDVLMRYDYEADEYVPQLAESLESNDELTSWTLTLREGVTFSDGTPLDAKAVVGSYNYYTSNRGSDTAILMTNVESVQAEDDRTVVFTLRAPWGNFPAVLATGVGMIVAPAAISGPEFQPIGAGPFELENYAPAESLTLTAREDYFDGRPNLDELRFVWPGQDQPKVDGLESGSVDAAMIRDPRLVDDLRAEEQPGFVYLAGGHLTLAINQREGEVGEDVRVRQAMTLALRPDVVYERAYGGAGLPGKKLFVEESRWGNDVPSQETNAEKATQLLDEAKADGFDGNVSLLNTGSPNGRAESQAIKGMLDAVGFTTELEYARSVTEQIQRAYIDNDFDVVRVAMSTSEEDPHRALNNNLNSTSFANAGGYFNPEADRLVRELQAASDEAERQRLIEEIERLWVEDVPAINLGAAPVYTAWRDQVHGLVPSAEMLTLFDEAWIEEE